MNGLVLPSLRSTAEPQCGLDPWSLPFYALHCSGDLGTTASNPEADDTLGDRKPLCLILATPPCPSAASVASILDILKAHVTWP